MHSPQNQILQTTKHKEEKLKEKGPGGIWKGWKSGGGSRRRERRKLGFFRSRWRHLRLRPCRSREEGSWPPGPACRTRSRLGLGHRVPAAREMVAAPRIEGSLGLLRSLETKQQQQLPPLPIFRMEGRSRLAIYCFRITIYSSRSNHPSFVGQPFNRSLVHLWNQTA